MMMKCSFLTAILTLTVIAVNTSLKYARLRLKIRLEKLYFAKRLLEMIVRW